MSTAKRSWLVTAALGGGFLLGGLVLVWPGYRETSDINRRLDELKEKVSRLDSRTREVERLATQVDAAHHRIASELRVVPETANIASLVRRLSLPADGVTILDQTFSASTPMSAIPGQESPIRAMPLMVDMEASFDSTFALLHAAESMDRLVRISSVKMIADHAEDEPGPPFLKASIGLEAIYEPLEAEGR